MSSVSLHSAWDNNTSPQQPKAPPKQQQHHNPSEPKPQPQPPKQQLQQQQSSYWTREVKEAHDGELVDRLTAVVGIMETVINVKHDLVTGQINREFIKMKNNLQPIIEENKPNQYLCIVGVAICVLIILSVICNYVCQRSHCKKILVDWDKITKFAAVAATP
jgi:hypothetical protein